MKLDNLEQVQDDLKILIAILQGNSQEFYEGICRKDSDKMRDENDLMAIQIAASCIGRLNYND